MTQDIVFGTTALHARLTHLRSLLVDHGVHGAPERGASRRCHGEDAPVGAKVLDAPDDGDDNGGQGEDGAVACADEGGHSCEARGVVLHPAACEQDLAEGEDKGKGEEEGDA